MMSPERSLGSNHVAFGGIIFPLSAALSEDADTIEDVYEPYLLANGFLERTARGRIATYKTFEALGRNPIQNKNLFDMD
jgi:Holliday junction DNA helicase RuvB